MNNHAADPPSLERVRPAVAMLLQPASVAQRETDGQWEPVPGGHGVVPVVGSPDVPITQWTLTHTDVTVAELRGDSDRLIAHGPGSLATVLWHAPAFGGAAVAWGPTAAEALGHLVRELGEIWPDLRAAAGVVADNAWAPGQQHITARGVRITAPSSGRHDNDQALWVRRAYIDVSAGTYDADWADAVRGTVGLDAVRAAESFARLHADLDRPPAFMVQTTGYRHVGPALVGPVTRFRDMVRQAIAAIGR